MEKSKNKTVGKSKSLLKNHKKRLGPKSYKAVISGEQKKTDSMDLKEQKRRFIRSVESSYM